MAMTAAIGIVTEPVIISGSAGKSHLLWAVFNYMATQRRGVRARVVTAESLMCGAAASLEAVDVLLIDGLRSLGRAQMTLLEILRERPSLQLLAACDNLADFKTIDTRLRLRLNQIVQIEPLEAETMLVIVRQLAVEAELDLSQAAARCIALSTNDPREAKGVVTQLAAQVRMGGLEPSLQLVTQITEDLTGIAPAITVEHVIRATAYVFGCSDADLRGGCGRSPLLATPAKIARYCARDLVTPRPTFVSLASAFGDRSAEPARRSTIQIGELRSSDEMTRHQLRLVKSAAKGFATAAAA